MVYQHPSGANNALLPFAHNESRPPNELALSTVVPPASTSTVNINHPTTTATNNIITTSESYFGPPYSVSGSYTRSGALGLGLSMGIGGYSSLTSDSLDGPSLPSSSIVDSEDGKGIYFFEEKRMAGGNIPGYMEFTSGNSMYKMEYHGISGTSNDTPKSFARHRERFSDNMLDDNDEEEEEEDGDNESFCQEENDQENSEKLGNGGGKRRRNFGTPSAKRFHDMTCDLPPSSPPPPVDMDEDDEVNDFGEFNLTKDTNAQRHVFETEADSSLIMDPHINNSTYTPPSISSSSSSSSRKHEKSTLKSAASFFSSRRIPAPMSSNGAYSANSISIVSPIKSKSAYRSAFKNPKDKQSILSLPLLSSSSSAASSSFPLHHAHSVEHHYYQHLPHHGPEPWGYAQAREIIKTACNDNDRSIHLDDMGLTDVPPEIADLKHMVWTDKNMQTICSDLHLYLANNQLTRVPPPLLALDNLTVLSLRGNQLTDLPPAVARFGRLQNLSIGINCLKYLPSELLLLKNLTVLAPHPNPYQQIPAEHRELAESIKQKKTTGGSVSTTDGDGYYFIQKEDTSISRPKEYTEGAIRYWVEPHVDLKKYGNLIAFARPVPKEHQFPEATEKAIASQPVHLPSPLPSPSSSFSGTDALKTPITDTFASTTKQHAAVIASTDIHLPSPARTISDKSQETISTLSIGEEAARCNALKTGLPPHVLVGPPHLSDYCARVVAAHVRPESAELDTLCDARTQPVVRGLVDEAAIAAQRGARCGQCYGELAAESAGTMGAGVGHAFEWWDGIKGHHGLVFVREFCSTRCVVEWAQGVNSQLPECLDLWASSNVRTFNY
ncbi:uncharacterized protein SAPINGB_P002006 [Magnusiomyces paraingens]|uniref:Uncharacterized protein n=1 Tax=Magnusiomyces paraingens TaxID=2606893 RepID=A0A5E8BHB5_9ASCO|nr:uncharacterized protein SAPINGB_P002006 [Saprochaete ingens]VVT48901.1 unnamed protein product [Saprochaete ingens]